MESIIFLLSYNAIYRVCFDFGLPHPHQRAAVQTLALQALRLHQYLCTCKSLHAEASHENPSPSRAKSLEKNYPYTSQAPLAMVCLKHGLCG